MSINLAALEALPDSIHGMVPMPWSKEEDDALLRYWPIKRKKDVAKTLGRGEHQCRARYEELIRDKPAAPRR